MLFLGDLVFYYKGLKHKRHMVHNFFGSLAPLAVLEISDGSGMEKVGFRRVRVYPNFQMSGPGMSGIEKVEFGRVLKFRASGIFKS